MATRELSPAGGVQTAGRGAASDPEHVRWLRGDTGVLLATSPDYQETLMRVAELAVPGLADWFSVELVTEDGAIHNVAVAHVDPERVELALELRRRFPPSPDAPHGVANVLRTGEPELYEEISDELLVEASQHPDQLAAARALELRSAVLVPLEARGRVFGVLTLVAAESGRRFGAEDLPFMEELASLAALSIDNARLFAGEQQARAEAERVRLRVERLQTFTAATAGTASSEEVVDTSLRAGLEAIEADRAAIYVLDEEGTTFELCGSVGYGDSLESVWPSFPADLPGPAREAVETRSLVVVESSEDLFARWPHLADPQGRSRGPVVCAPLESGGRVQWLLILGFAADRTLHGEDRALISTMARQCTLTLERAALYDSERRARADALRLARRLRMVQEVTDATIAPASLDELLHEVLERVRQVLGADTAAVLILDEEGDGLVSRASIGLDEQAYERMRIPLGSGFAGTIAVTREPLRVEDVDTYPIYREVLRESGVRSLLGVPLLAPDDRVVGVLHVGSRERRSFTDDDASLLQLVASRAALAVEHAMMVDSQRRVARTLQRSLLPERLPRFPGVRIAARYAPGGDGLEVGGDWYDALDLGGGRLLFTVGDVVGKGLPAAAAMGQLRNALRAYAVEGLEPAEILERLNQLSFELGRKELFATVLVAVLDVRRAEARLASAGHPPALLVVPGAEPSFVEDGRSLPLGAVREIRFEETTVKLPADATVLVYTDGLVERRTTRIEDSLELLRHAASEGPEELEQLLDHLLAAFPTDEHEDDLAVIAIRALGRLVGPLQLRYPAKPSVLAALRGSLRDWLVRAGASEAEAHEVVVACNEACTNSIEHPLRSPGEDFFEVEADCAGGELALVVRDFGRWRDAGPTGDRGRGLKFIHALMDEVDVRSSATGTEVHMRRRLRPPP